MAAIVYPTTGIPKYTFLTPFQVQKGKKIKTLDEALNAIQLSTEGKERNKTSKTILKQLRAEKQFDLASKISCVAKFDLEQIPRYKPTAEELQSRILTPLQQERGLTVEELVQMRLMKQAARTYNAFPEEVQSKKISAFAAIKEGVETDVRALMKEGLFYEAKQHLIQIFKQIQNPDFFDRSGRIKDLTFLTKIIEETMLHFRKQAEATPDDADPYNELALSLILEIPQETIENSVYIRQMITHFGNSLDKEGEGADHYIDLIKEHKLKKALEEKNTEKAIDHLLSIPMERILANENTQKDMRKIQNLLAFNGLGISHQNTLRQNNFSNTYFEVREALGGSLPK